ncbi:MAG: prolyl oligopeptidase family serine peptidase [Verrucomicrobiota bacterium]
MQTRCFGRLPVFWLTLVLFLTGGVTLSAATEVSRQSELKFEREIRKTLSADYLLYLPKQYDAEPEKHWPLIIFLHSSGERGEDISKVARHGPPHLIEQGKDFPFIIVSPLCPHDNWWNLEMLNAFYDTVLETYRVDPDRVYLTGLSMGGFGTWNWAVQNPEKFAAIAPIASWGPNKNFKPLVDMPIWAVHGEKDQAVKLHDAQKVINAIKEAGGDPRFTIYKGAGHNVWSRTYEDPEFYQWLLSHSKEKQIEVKE